MATKKTMKVERALAGMTQGQTYMLVSRIDMMEVEYLGIEDDTINFREVEDAKRLIEYGTDEISRISQVSDDDIWDETSYSEYSKLLYTVVMRNHLVYSIFSKQPIESASNDDTQDTMNPDLEPITKTKIAASYRGALPMGKLTSLSSERKRNAPQSLEEQRDMFRDMDRIRRNETVGLYTRNEGDGRISVNKSDGVLGRLEWRDQVATLYEADAGEATLITRDKYGMSVALDVAPKEAYRLISILKKFINTEYGKNN